MPANRVRVLDEATVNKIAAGEVVERPMSVVKELVENAIDAGARHITVEMESGGIERISVTDDGCGMSPEDARMALERHATSKIQSADDLISVATLGFRGEALPSIAAVSRMELVTREKGAISGTRLIITGGSVQSQEPYGCPEGTRVTVSSLFFNVPARRKFLKGPAAELDRATGVLISLALARPDISFCLRNDGRELVRTPGRGELKETVLSLFGRELAEQLVAVDDERHGTRIAGLVGKPGVSRASRSHQFFFVNGRPISGFPLNRALDEAYSGLLPLRRFPIAFLFITCQPGEIDVNVHPAKLQVRFRRERELLDAIRLLVRDAIRTTRPADVGWTAVTRLPTSAAEGRATYEPGVVDEPELSPLGLRNEDTSSGGTPSRLPWVRLIGQLASTYILAEGPDGLLIIDQHAAHERVNFELIRRRLQEGVGVSQQLAIPQSVHLRPEEMDTWERNRSFFERAGFQAEQFGRDTVLLRGVPLTVGGGGCAEAFLDLIAKLRDEGWGAGTPDYETLARAAMISCKASVRAGDALSIREMEQLIAELARCEEPLTCPHGRPVAVRITCQDLERRFGRI